MQLCTQSDSIEVRRVDNRGKGGRGVFATRAIGEGEVLEKVPGLLIPREQVFADDPGKQQASKISWYVFDCPFQTKRVYVVLALGYGSIYNHSPAPNARVEFLEPDLLQFIATRPIAAGEEILINYAGDGQKKDVGFEISRE